MIINEDYIIDVLRSRRGRETKIFILLNNGKKIYKEAKVGRKEKKEKKETKKL